MDINIDQAVSRAFSVSVTEAKRLRVSGAITIDGVKAYEPLICADKGSLTIKCGQRWKKIVLPVVYDWRSGWSDDEIALALKENPPITAEQAEVFRAAHRDWKIQTGAA